MENINWSLKTAIAKRMTISELNNAIIDCLECCRIMGNDEMKGKDSNYYRDEMSIYREELRRREKK